MIRRKHLVSALLVCLEISFSCCLNCQFLGLKDPAHTSIPDGKSVVFGKTFETFKLADLYFLETSLRSEKLDLQPCERICIDPATGSSLLSLDKRFFDKNGEERMSVERFEWLGSEIAFGETVQDLLKSVKNSGGIIEQHSKGEGGFSLDYICMGKSDRGTNRFTSKSLICCMSQLLKVPAALDPRDAIHDLILVETSNGIHLIEPVQIETKKDSGTDLQKQWSKRPFQYSSAINPTVANIVIDLIYDLIPKKEKNDVLTILDPTCGSGTLLAFALNRGFSVHGRDINPRCVDGTLRNLEVVFGEEKIKNNCLISIEDSASACIDHDGGISFDCAVANIPWGQNTAITDQELNKVCLFLSL